MKSQTANSHNVETPYATDGKASDMKSIREKKTYAKFMDQGVSLLNVTETAPQFDSEDEIIPVEEGIVFYKKLIKEIKNAIKEGDIKQLQFNLGPSLYHLRQMNNRRINQLRWLWLDAREVVEFYIQIFNFVIWYGRKYAFDRYPMALQILKQQLAAEREQTSNHRSIKTGLLFTQGETLVVTCTNRKPDVKPGEKTDVAKELEKNIGILEVYLKRYSEIVEVYKTDGLEAYVAKLKSLPQNMLKQMYESAKQHTSPILDFAEAEHLKQSLKNILKKLPEMTATHFGGLAKQTFAEEMHISSLETGEQKEEFMNEQPEQKTPSAGRNIAIFSPMTLSVVKKQVQQHAFKNPKIQEAVAEEIDKIFAKTTNLETILAELYQLWQNSRLACGAFENEYLQLTSHVWREKQTTGLISEFKQLFASGALEETDEIQMNEILKYEMGACSLSEIESAAEKQSQGRLLLMALHICAEHAEAKDQEKIARISIVSYLIRRGSCPFSLPHFQNTDSKLIDSKQMARKNTFTNPERLNWLLLIVVLESLVCTTPVAEEVRKILLNYSEKSTKRGDGRFDTLGRKRNKAVTTLTKLLIESQQPCALQETLLIQKIKVQILTEERGLLGRSELYKKLKMLVDRVEREELMMIHDDKDHPLEEQNNQLVGFVSASSSALFSSSLSSSSSSSSQPMPVSETSTPYRPIIVSDNGLFSSTNPTTATTAATPAVNHSSLPREEKTSDTLPPPGSSS